MLMWMAASSLFARSKARRAWLACVDCTAVAVVAVAAAAAAAASPEARGDAGREEGMGGNSSRTIMSRMWGTELVATASSVGSVGQTAIEAGEKAIQPEECGARFWLPRRVIRSVSGASENRSGSE